MLPPWERRRHACELPAIRASPTGVTVMRFFPPLKTATIEQIQPGTCFAFDLRGTTHIGIAVVPVFAGEAPAFAGEAGARSEEQRLNSSHTLISYAVFC